MTPLSRRSATQRVGRRPRVPSGPVARAAAIALLGGALLLAGCRTDSPEPVRSERVVALADAALPSREVDPEAFVPVTYEAEDATAWWTAFEDEALASLISAALGEGFDVRIAFARLAETRSLVRSAGAARWPTLSVVGSFSVDDPLESLQGPLSNLETPVLRDRTSQALAGLQVDWPLDLFGRLRATERAALARTDSAAALLRDVQRVLAVQVASLYLQVRSVQQRARIARESEARRVENVQRIERLTDQGYGTLLDLRRTENQLQQARANIATFETQQVEFINQLAVLADRDLLDARRSLAPEERLWAVPAEAPLPSLAQLLRQRPDLRASERALAAAAAELDASRAALYPSITLAGSAFAQGSEIGLSPSLGLAAGRLVTDLAMPLLGRGQVLAQVDRSDAQLAAALATYEQTVVRAVAEIDAAMNALARARRIYRLSSAAASSAREAEVLSRRLFIAGELDYVSVVVAEQTRATAEDAAVVAHRDALLAYVRYVGAVAPQW